MSHPTSTARAAFVAAALALLATTGEVSAAKGFEPIGAEFDTPPLGVVLPSICIGDFIVPRTMYTLEPSAPGTNVTVLSKPKDLVESGYDSETGIIYLKFVLPVSDETEDAGVIIQFPSDQLVSVNTCCSQSVQIKDGFTNFQSLTASTSAIVNAEFGVQQASDLAIGSFSSAEVNVAVTSGALKSKVDVTAEGSATVNVGGNINTLSCMGKSTCVIGGKIEDRTSSKIAGNSTAQTNRCANIDVAAGSTCVTKTSTVTVDTLGLTIANVKEQCVNGGDLEGNGAPVMAISSAPTISPAPVVPTLAPTAKPTAAPVVPSSASMQSTSLAIALSGALLFLLLGQ